jgi:MFS family permease
MNAVKKLWNKNFAILWQSQFISDFGNAAFSVALGFWVLAVTKSTALMGVILACFSVPRVLVGPLAGALADRLDRKWIIVLTDLVRGVVYAAMGVTVLLNAFPFEAIYPLAILAGICDAFFDPALSSSVPDIVPKENLSQANAARSLSTTFTQLMGNSLGGVLYALLSGPLMILLNGVSFFYASVTQLFMKIPRVQASAVRRHILGDMLNGIKYVFSHRGLRMLMISSMILNFFAVMGMTLLTPLFNEGLGVKMYGYMMGAFTAGAVSGMVVFSIVKVKPSQRSALFSVAMLAMVLAMVPVGILRTAAWLFPLAFVAGICNAVVNMMIQTILQATVPAENRGKVFGIADTISSALMPLAMAASGLIASVAGLRPTIVCSFAVLVFAALPLLMSKNVKTFINTDTAFAPAAVELAPAGLEEEP